MIGSINSVKRKIKFNSEEEEVLIKSRIRRLNEKGRGGGLTHEPKSEEKYEDEN